MSLTLIIVLLSSHFLADWILQPRQMAKEKSEKFTVCLIHGLIVWGILSLALLFSNLSVGRLVMSIIGKSIIY